MLMNLWQVGLPTQPSYHSCTNPTNPSVVILLYSPLILFFLLQAEEDDDDEKASSYARVFDDEIW